MAEPGSERLDLVLGQDARQRQKTLAVERIAFGPRQRIVAHAKRLQRRLDAQESIPLRPVV